MIEENSGKWNCPKCGAELKELEISKQKVHVCPICDPDFRKRCMVIDGFTHPAGTSLHWHIHSQTAYSGAYKKMMFYCGIKNRDVEVATGSGRCMESDEKCPPCSRKVAKER